MSPPTVIPSPLGPEARKPEFPGLGQKIATGATWMLLQRLAMRVIGLISTIILARLLVPEDFGLVALAATLLAVLETVLELGFDLALIQRQTTDRSMYDTAWTLTILRGLLTALLLAAAAFPLANFYNDPRLATVVFWLALVAVFNGFQNIGIVEFRIELRFEQEFRMLVWSKVAMFIVTVGLAWLWRDYRALVAGILTGKGMLLVLSYTMHSYRPRLSLKGAMPFLHFSKWLFLNNLIILVRNRLDTFVVGKLSSPTALGHYAVAYEISNLATTELMYPIARALFPGFARMQGDPTRLSDAFVASLGIMFFIGAPMAVGVGLIAEHIVRLFLGVQWMPVVSLIQVLSLYGLLSLPAANGQPIYLAIGRPDLITWRGLPSVIVLPPSLIAGVYYYGPIGAAWALVFSAAVGLVVHFWLINRQLPVSPGAIFDALWRPALALLVMSAVVISIDRAWPDDDAFLRELLQTVCLVTAGALSYFGAIGLCWLAAGRPDGAEKRILSTIAEWIASRRPAAPPVASESNPPRV
ncbi:MAG: lipopolysaccharide biosynthesis protein [Rhodospirillaceae bacterium]